MTPIAILSSTRRPGTCRSCGAAIEWATVASSNRHMPFDPPILLIGALDLPLDVVRVDMARTTSHFATCPDAVQWRRRHK